MTGIRRRAGRVQVPGVSAQVCLRASDKAFPLIWRNVGQVSRIRLGDGNAADLDYSCADHLAVFGRSARDPQLIPKPKQLEWDFPIEASPAQVSMPVTNHSHDTAQAHHDVAVL